MRGYQLDLASSDFGSIRYAGSQFRLQGSLFDKAELPVGLALSTWRSRVAHLCARFDRISWEAQNRRDSMVDVDDGHCYEAWPSLQA